jgi:RND family efflux transporter MFP subunit
MGSMRKRTKIVGAVVVAGVMALALAHSQGLLSGKKGAAAAKAVPTVTITTPQRRDLPVELIAQGHLVALNTVDIRPQVAGVIRTVDFHEGDTIRAGQLLFTLDDTDLAAQLRRAEANAANMKAQLDDAVRAQDRAVELLKAKFLSQSAVDTAVSKTDSLRAQLHSSNADIDSARVQVAHTRIVSPLSGKAGALNVHVGSLAQPTSTIPLVSLAQFDPIGVEFSVPEANLDAILTAKAAGPVKVALDTPEGRHVEGELSFINNTVTTGSGTINLKAVFPNAQQTLWPGAYVKTTVSAGVTRNAMLLAPHAILEGPGGRFVYVLDGANKVSAKPVTLVRVQGEQAIVEGLLDGDRIVLDGNQAVSPGALVQVAPKAEVATTK